MSTQTGNQLPGSISAPPGTVILEDARLGLCRVFPNPIEVIEANDTPQVIDALQKMQARTDAGLHLAGYFSYELGYLLDDCLTSKLPPDRSVPLIWFGVFDQPAREIKAQALDELWTGCRGYAGPLRPEWTESAYTKRFDRVAEWIKSGEIYQANLSMRCDFAFAGDARGLYLAMRRRAGAAYGAYVDDGRVQLLSLSPELFFEVSRDGKIRSKPIKGTAARGHDDVQDRAMRDALHASMKNRAENLMIVDLVRNDISRIANVGSVAVNDLFSIETFPTVHQMVSEVSATIKPGTGIDKIVRALFPCGSITGAPKIRSMEIIRELESSPRGVYCGAIGYISPDGTSQFNVGIRTITIEGNQGELGIGGGLVADSTAEDEYQECLLKARYFELGRKPIKLIETMRYERRKFARMNFHLERLEAAAARFRIPFDPEQLLARLSEEVRGVGPLRVRLTIDERGLIEIMSTAISTPISWRYIISDKVIESGDELLRYKTTWREMYDSERESAAAAFDCDEVIFFNERSELCEGSRSNIFLSKGGMLLTPASCSGLLDGCLRRELLAAGTCQEAVLSEADLVNADDIYFGNSVHGLIPAKLATSRQAA